MQWVIRKYMNYLTNGQIGIIKNNLRLDFFHSFMGVFNFFGHPIYLKTFYLLIKVNFWH